MKTNYLLRPLLYLLFFTLAFVILYPIVFTLANSFKTDVEAYANSMSLLTEGFSFQHYIDLFDRLPMLRIIMNTFFISTVVTFGKLVLSLFASYALVYFSFRGKDATLSMVLMSMFIPFTVIMIPNYLLMADWGLSDNIWGAILPQIFSAMGIFLLNQSMRGIPISLIEAARLDGIGHIRTMKDIIIPIVKPQLIATGIWFFAGTWNDFVWSSIMLRTKENYTLPLALQMFISGEGGDGFTSAMAMAGVTMFIPLVMYIIFQKHIVEMFTTSGIK